MTTGESVSQPKYKGTGMVVLEPSFNHFLVLELDDEEIIVDKGMFYCAQGGVTVKPIMQKKCFLCSFRWRGYISNITFRKRYCCFRMCCSCM